MWCSTKSTKFREKVTYGHVYLVRKLFTASKLIFTFVAEKDYYVIVLSHLLMRSVSQKIIPFSDNAITNSTCI